MTDFYELYPHRVRDISCHGRWTRDFYSERRWFQTRYYVRIGPWLIRVPWLAWTMLR